MLFVGLSTNAQDYYSKLKASLELAEKLFNEKEYQKSIDVVDNAISSCQNQTDDICIELLIHKALCFNWLNENNEALSLLQQIHSTCYNDALKNRICYLYCAISSNTKINFGSELYVQYATNLIMSEYRLNKSLAYYIDGFLVKHGNELSLNEISDILKREKLKFASNSILFMDPVLDYLHGCLCSCVYNPLFAHHRSIKDKQEAINYFTKAISKFQNYNDVYILEYLFDSYEELGQIYEFMGHNSSASTQYKKMLELGYLYWNEWGYKSPLASGDAGNDILIGFENYTSNLMKSKQFQVVVDYCDQVLKDDAILSNKYASTIKEDVNSVKSEALKQLNENIEEQDAVNNQKSPYDIAIALYQYGRLNKEALENILKKNDEYPLFGGWTAMLSNFLYSNGEYELVKQLTIFVIDKFAELYKEDGSEYDLLATEREEWHYSNGPGVIFQMYYYLSQANLSLSEFEHAIKNMQHVIDIVKTDSHYDPEERERLFESYLKGNHSIDYVNTEVFMYDQLAYIYLCSNRYEDAYKTYRYALDLNLRILQTVLEYGSASIKQIEWDEYSQIYHSVISALSDSVDSYPHFAKLIMESSSMIKGFILNLHLKTKENAYLSNKLQTLYNEKQLAEKYIERSNYTQTITEQYITNIDNIDIQINNKIDIKKIVANSAMTYDNIRTKLQKNDVVVDLFYIQSGQSIEKKSELDTIEYNEHFIETWKQQTFYDSYLYANVTRNNWEIPVLICLGKISDALQGQTKDLFDYLFIYNNDPQSITDLYSNQALGQFVWNKILDIGQIKPNDNIYIIPSGIFNRLSIENLTLDSQLTISDQYTINRISSFHNINTNNKLYSSDDTCVAFGDIDYAGSDYLKTNDNKTLNSNPVAILDRRQLGGLSSTLEVVNTIAKTIPNTRMIVGGNANESAFNQLSNSSPEILFMGTHGFNYEYSEISDKDKEYLLGKYRDRKLSDEEQSMYTSGLFMAKSNSDNILTDGMLTANEVGFCNLDNTKLAVLSACSTAMGTTSTEGVYGLQRGFKMAGVKSIIASLWDVDEYATRLLMGEFFRNYTKGCTKHEALKKAQNYVRKYKSNDIFNPVSYSSPYYWAGFILID